MDRYETVRLLPTSVGNLGCEVRLQEYLAANPDKTLHSFQILPDGGIVVVLEKK